MMKKFQKTESEIFPMKSGITSGYGTPASQKQQRMTEAVAWEILSDAYEYTFSLMIMNATLQKMTNTVKPTHVQAPVNQLIHARGIANSHSRNVVTPNVDTIYSQAFLELTDEPMVLTKPAVDRYCSIELIDAYTNCFALLGTGGDTQDFMTYLLTGPAYKGKVPDGMQEIKVPTNMAWMIIRILYNGGKADLEKVYTIQSNLKLVRLSVYGTDNYIPPQGRYFNEYDFIPVEHVRSLKMTEYFHRANTLIAQNPPAGDDAPALERFKGIGVGAGLELKRELFINNPDGQWKQLISSLNTQLFVKSQHYMVPMEGWQYFGEPIAKYGTNYSYRALIALVGLGANPVEMAIYPRTNVDCQGEKLNGNHQYMIHFEANGLPPVKQFGFWSITVYNSDNFLVENKINRYCINDRSKLIRNSDGSIDIYLQVNPVDKKLMDNWLPVSRDDFHLVMRIFLPQESVFNGGWKAPEIVKAGLNS